MEELQALLLEEDTLALVERQTRDDRSPLLAPHEDDADDHEDDDENREQRARHRRIV